MAVTARIADAAHIIPSKSPGVANPNVLPHLTSGSFGPRESAPKTALSIGSLLLRGSLVC